MADALFKVYLPVLTHQGEFFLESRGTILRRFDIRVKFLDSIVVLVVVM